MSNRKAAWCVVGFAIFVVALNVSSIWTYWHQPQTISSNTQLTNILKLAQQEQKNVLLHFGGPSCIYCRYLSKFLEEHDDIVRKYYIVAHFEDQPLRETLDPEKSINNPWMVILDPEGKVLAHSNDQNGENIGFPSSPEGIHHFQTMLTASSGVTPAEQAELEEGLTKMNPNH